MRHKRSPTPANTVIGLSPFSGPTPELVLPVPHLTPILDQRLRQFSSSIGRPHCHRSRYSLAADATVTLEVFNILGQKVRSLVDGRSLPAGAYEAFWDGNNEQGEPVGSGAYLYRLTAGDLTDTRRMILLK